MHWSFVQALPSTGMSVSSLTVRDCPIPSHSSCLQSPPICGCAGSTFPTAAFWTPQVPFVQVCVWQVVLVPQSAATLQPTQVPWPLQIKLAPQAVPLARFGFVGTPAVQTSVVQALPSTGRSRSSLTMSELPVMQTVFLQSPGVSPDTAIPSAMLAVPQTPLVQVRWRQSVSVPGQAVASSR